MQGITADQLAEATALSATVRKSSAASITSDGTTSTADDLDAAGDEGYKITPIAAATPTTSAVTTSVSSSLTHVHKQPSTASRAVARTSHRFYSNRDRGRRPSTTAVDQRHCYHACGGYRQQREAFPTSGASTPQTESRQSTTAT